MSWTPRSTRGRIINPRNGTFYEFPINPEEISFTKDSELVETKIPGVSDPMVIWASGGTETFPLSLRIHGEDNLRMRGSQYRNQAVAGEITAAEATTKYSIAAEVEWLLQFLHPARLNQQGATGGADPVIVRVGRAIPGVLALLASAKVTYSDFTADLEPADAKVDLTFKRVQAKPRFANDVWR